jgi:hypothetical protein
MTTNLQTTTNTPRAVAIRTSGLGALALGYVIVSLAIFSIVLARRDVTS